MLLALTLMEVTFANVFLVLMGMASLAPVRKHHIYFSYSNDVYSYYGTNNVIVATFMFSVPFDIMLSHLPFLCRY